MPGGHPVRRQSAPSLRHPKLRAPLQGFPDRWRVLRDPPASGAWNMAVDTALALHIPEGVGVLRLYSWASPTLSFGRHQAVRNRYDPRALDRMGVSAVRRPTGGREVLHHFELTYTVVLRHPGPGFARGVYREVNETLLDALRSLGLEVSLAESAPPPAHPDAGPCFQRPAEGEVMGQGRKLVGSAQARIGSALLQHGSLLLSPTPFDLLSLCPPAMPLQAGPVGITLAELAAGRPPVTFAEVGRAIEAACRSRWAQGGRAWEEGFLAPKERFAAAESLEKYQASEWTWRR
jgi:lipoyl(octanoyl) transferase